MREYFACLGSWAGLNCVVRFNWKQPTWRTMQVSTANDVKVYNLSVGKTLPEWISDRKRRTLLKNDVGKASSFKPIAILEVNFLPV